MKGLCSHDTGRDGGGCRTHRCIWSASSFGALVGGCAGGLDESG
jgi:hypothetical protein